MANDPLRGDRGHVLVGLVHALPALKPQREGDRVGEVTRSGWYEFVGRVSHSGSIAKRRERNKNTAAATFAPLDKSNLLVKP